MNIQQDVNLQPYNTFHLDCRADYFVEITKIEDFQALLQTKIFLDNPCLILGGGSNILLTQPTYQGLIIKNNILGKEVIHQDDTSITIKVGAGENRNDFVRRSINQGYCGIENLVSIPGSVGAAPIQNIGAYGVEAKSTIQNIDCIRMVPPVKGVASSEQREDLAGGLFSLTNSQCYFSYRSSLFKTDLKDQTFITHVTFKLKKYRPTTYTPTISYGAIQDQLEKQGYTFKKSPNERPSLGKEGLREDFITPKLLAQTISKIRSSKLPDRTKLGTAGSFFKNPIVSQEKYNNLQKKFPTITGFSIPSPLGKGERGGFMKLSAGQLIDLSGLKGITQGNVGTYQNHALVLVHHGGGTGQELVKLATHIQTKVYDTFGIQLEPEVNYIM